MPLAQARGRHRPDRHGVTVWDIERGRGLDRVGERVTEVQRMTDPAVLRVGFDVCGLDPDGLLDQPGEVRRDVAFVEWHGLQDVEDERRGRGGHLHGLCQSMSNDVRHFPIDA